MNGLDLFSGVGGISLALSPWVKTVAYCERDKYAQAVLLSRMAEGQLDAAPIWDDVTTLDGTQFKGVVDIIFGGFPCQDISCAGRGEGLEAKRSGLFFEIMRLAQEIKPKFIFLENVAAIRTKGLDAVIGELSSLRYDCRWGMLSAFDVGAPHKRERWFCFAHSKSNRRRIQPERSRNQNPSDTFDNGKNRYVADTLRGGFSHGCTQAEHSNAWEGATEDGRFWDVEPGILRISDELSKGVDCRVGMGAAEKEEVDEEVSVVRCLAKKKEIWEEVGRQNGLCKKSLLFQEMYGSGHGETNSYKKFPQYTSQETLKGVLRKVRNNQQSSGTPHKPGLVRQQTLEFDDSMCIVSHFLASRNGTSCEEERDAAVHSVWKAFLQTLSLSYPSNSIEKVWESISEADQDWLIMAACFGVWHDEWPGTTRVATGIPNRVDRIKCLGNAVVPAQAREAFRRLSGL